MQTKAVLILFLVLFSLAFTHMIYAGNTGFGGFGSGTPDTGGGSGGSSGSTSNPYFCNQYGQPLSEYSNLPNSINVGVCICPVDLINQQSSSSGYIADNGYTCTFYNESIIITYYPSAGNAGLLNNNLFSLSSLFNTQSLSTPVPIIAAILSYNNAESPSLITCPAPIDYTNTTEYFYKAGTFMGGNRCLQNSLPLVTAIHYNTVVNFNTAPFFITDLFATAPVTASASYAINGNPIPSSGGSFGSGLLNSIAQFTSLFGVPLFYTGIANGTVNTLAYSGETTLANTVSSSYGPYNISSAYNTQSYIFQNINSTPQQSLWTWSAKYANLAQTDLNYLDINKEVTNLHSDYTGIDFAYYQCGYVPVIIPVGIECNFEYSYTLHSYVNTLENTNFQVPVYNAIAANAQSGYELKVGDYAYAPAAPLGSVPGADSACSHQMDIGGQGCDGWIKISLNGSVIIPGYDSYTVPVYAKATSGQPRGVPGILDYIAIPGYGNCYCNCGAPQPKISVPIPMSVVSVYTVQHNTGAFVQDVYNILDAATGYTYYTCYNRNPGPYSTGNGGLIWKFGSSGTSGGWLGVSPQWLPIVDYIAPVGVNDGGYGSGFVLANSYTDVAYNSVGIMPVFADTFSLPTPYTQGSQPSYLNDTYEVYSPNNFAGASNVLYSYGTTPGQVTGVEPYNLYTGSGFLATYSTQDNVPGNLVAMTYNFNSPLINSGFIDNFLMTYGGVSVGDSSLTGMQNVPAVSYLTDGPDGTIYAIKLTSASNAAGSFNWLQQNPISSIAETFETASKVTNSLLIKLNYVPAGDLLSPGPAVISPQNSYDTWNTINREYFEESLLYHTPQLAITGFTVLSSTTTSQSLWGDIFGSNPAAVSQIGSYNQKVALGQPFIALGAVTDTAGDLFMVSSHIQGEPKGTFGLAVIPTNGVPVIDDQVSPNPQSTPLAVLTPSSEIAVSSTGQYVFLANASDESGLTAGYVFIYDVQTGFKPIGTINLEYGNDSYGLNITHYLALGGPYNDGTLKAFYGKQNLKYETITPGSGKAYLGMDTASYHHPVAISDSQGILYVLDNWTFRTEDQTGIEHSSIWMLRAFTENGVEIHIDGSTNDTLQSSADIIAQETGTSGGSSGTTGGAAGTAQQYSVIQPAVTYPPYGWPLAANISTNWGSQYSLPEEVNYCAADCAMGIQLDFKGYPPVGPYISATGMTGPNADDAGFTTDYQGNIYLMAHAYLQTNKAWYQFLTPSTQFSYAELLALHPSIQNYTKTSFGAYSNYTCLIAAGPDAIPPPGAPSGTPNGDVLIAPFCQQAPAVMNLINLYPPILLMPDEFEYLAGQGSPAINLNAQSLAGSFFPEGVTSNTEQANSLFNNGLTGANSIDYNSLFNSQPGLPLVNVPSVQDYLASNTFGSVLVPYHIQYTVDQSWSVQNPGKMLYSIPPGGTNYEPPSLSGCYPVSWILSPACSLPSLSSSHQVVDLYTFQQAALMPGSVLNETIEGGNIYVNDRAVSTPYLANLSDAGLVVLPARDYAAFTDKLIGEIYVNRTITPTEFEATAGLNYLNFLSNGGSISIGSLPGSSYFKGLTQVVLNASNGYRYSILPFMQGPVLTSISLQSFVPGYLTQVAIPVGPTPDNTVIGADCGTVCTVGSISGALGQLFGNIGGSSIITAVLSDLHYYYVTVPAQLHIYGGPSNFTLNVSNGTQQYELYSLFKHGAYTYNITLALTGNDVLGYNRLLYTYVDRFNNTVYMPVDADFANITQIQLNATTLIDPANYNQTQITVNGIALSSGLGGIEPLKNSKIYLYYDANLNYLNTSLLSAVSSVPSAAMTAACLASSASSIGSVSRLQGLIPSYSKYAIDCTYATNSLGCQLANPLDCGGSNTLIDAAQLIEPEAVNYAPDYSSGTNSCPPPPNSLLAQPTYNCNIFGPALPGVFNLEQAISQYGGTSGIIPTADLPSYAIGPNGPEYCAPYFTNGTGIFTSQLGLMSTVTTDSNGLFSYTFNACGVGQNRVIAEYYGAPPPQPLYGLQPDLSHSDSLIAQPSQYVTSPEYNFYDSPNYTIATFETGSYLLELGNIYAWAPIIIILILILAARASTGQGGTIFQYMGFSTLTNLASGIGSGKAGKGFRGAKYADSRSLTKPSEDMHRNLVMPFSKNNNKNIGSGRRKINAFKQALNKSRTDAAAAAAAKKADGAASQNMASAGAIVVGAAAATGMVNMSTGSKQRRSVFRRIGDYSRSLAEMPGAVTIGEFVSTHKLDPYTLRWVPRKNARVKEHTMPEKKQEDLKEKEIKPVKEETGTGIQSAKENGPYGRQSPPTQGQPPDGDMALYAELGLSPGASDEEIKRAFRSKSMQVHPDKSDDPAAAAKFASLKRAYDALKAKRGFK